MDTCPHAEDREGRRILVWHVYQRCMVYDCEKARDNRFIAYWQEIPDRWIPIADRKPTRGDANPLGVVIVKDTHGNVRLRGWQQAAGEPEITHWMPTPEAPENYKELREAMDQPDARERIDQYDTCQHHKHRGQRH